MPRVLVVGSINVDIVVTTERLPAPGETVLGGTLLINDGGKGANQAVAAVRAGGEVRFLGCVGDDASGTRLRHTLAAEGILQDGVVTVPDVATGTALIVVDAAGQNQIAVASGANLHLTIDHLARHLEAFLWAEVVLCQLETPLAPVLWTLRTARAYGAITILNPAPMQPLPAEIWPLVDYVTPNAIELAQYSGREIDHPRQVSEAAQALQAKGPRATLVTLGEQGVCVCTATGVTTVPAFPVTAIDTTAAGDAFNGALAVALAEQRSLLEAVRFASAAAALTCTRHGAQVALPHRLDVDTLLAS